MEMGILMNVFNQRSMLWSLVLKKLLNTCCNQFMQFAMYGWNLVKYEWGSSFFLFGGVGVYPYNVTLELHLSCLRFQSTQEKQTQFVIALNLDSYNLRMSFFKHKILNQLFYVITKLVGFFCIGINIFGSFGQIPCEMLVIFLFMKLQLVGVVMGTLIWFISQFALDTKTSFEDFCDFVLIFKIP